MAIALLDFVVEDTRAFYYGYEQDEVNELADPFYILAEFEEEVGIPLAFIK